MYWLKGILLWFLRTVFHEADLHYVDSDALLFPAALPASEECITFPFDVLIVASDVDSNINAGWLYVRKGCPPDINIERAEIEWDAARYKILQDMTDLCSSFQPVLYGQPSCSCNTEHCV